MELEAVDHVAVIVRDLPSATRFYQQVLGLHRVHEQVGGEYPVALVAWAVYFRDPDGHQIEIATYAPRADGQGSDPQARRPARAAYTRTMPHCSREAACRKLCGPRRS